MRTQFIQTTLRKEAIKEFPQASKIIKVEGGYGI